MWYIHRVLVSEDAQLPALPDAARADREWAELLEIDFDDDQIDNVTEELDAGTVEKCTEAWRRWERVCNACGDTTAAQQARTHAAALEAKAADIAGPEDGDGA